MGEVETQPFRRYQGTFLFHMRTENHFQGFLKKMCRAVVLFRIPAFSLGYRKGDLIPCRDHAGFHMSHMAEFSAAELDGIFHRKSSVGCLDHAGISFLAAHGCIERSFFYKYGSFLSFHQRGNDLALCGKHGYL